MMLTFTNPKGVQELTKKIFDGFSITVPFKNVQLTEENVPSNAMDDFNAGVAECPELKLGE